MGKNIHSPAANLLNQAPPAVSTYTSVVTVDPLESFPVCLTKRYLLASKLGASSIAFPYPDGAVARDKL